MKQKLLKVELKNAYWFPPGAKIAIIPEGRTRLEVFEVVKRKKNTLWVKEWDYSDDQETQKA